MARPSAAASALATIPSIEAFLSRAIPNPTAEDNEDISAMAFAYARIMHRRAKAAEAKIAEQATKIIELSQAIQRQAEDKEPPAPPDDDREYVE